METRGKTKSKESGSIMSLNSENSTIEKLAESLLEINSEKVDGATATATTSTTTTVVIEPSQKQDFENGVQQSTHVISSLQPNATQQSEVIINGVVYKSSIDTNANVQQSEHRSKFTTERIQFGSNLVDIEQLSISDNGLNDTVKPNDENSQRYNVLTNPLDSRKVALIGMRRIKEIAETTELLPGALETQIKLIDSYHQTLTKKFQENENEASSVTEQNENMAIKLEGDELYAIVSSLLRNKLYYFEQNDRNATFAANRSSSSNNNERRSSGSGIKVESLRIEKFSGDYKKWRKFKEQFEQFFHKNDSLSKVEKLYQLDAHIEVDSEPYNAVSGYSRTENNYDAIWGTLCEIYENERRLVEDIIYQFIDLPPISTPTRSALIFLINAINHIVASLPKFDIQVKHWDAMIVPMVMRKLDDDTLRMWKLERPQRSIAKLSQLVSVMQKRADSIDSDERMDTSSQSNNNRNSSNRASTSQQNNNGKQRFNNKGKKQPISCCMCGQEHQLFRCQSFLKLSVELRKQKVRSFGVCETCLKKFCKKGSDGKCTLGACKHCSGNHNGLLCPQAEAPTVALASNQN